MGIFDNPKLKPYLIVSKRGNMNVFKVAFRSLADIELYLNSNPPINSRVFVSEKSITAKEAFAGEPLEKAIEYCVRGYDKGFEGFLKLQRELDSVNVKTNFGRKVTTSVVGARPNVPAYIAGAPKNMYRVDRVSEKKLIHIYMNLAYSRFTTEEQIINRGLLVLNLIRLLEENNYMVDFQVFETCVVENETFICEILLKQPGTLLDTRKCYYPLCGKAFVRRVITRIKETMPFEGNWHFSYGTVLNTIQTRIVMNIPEDAILINSPDEMGIQGDDIYKDADAFFEILGLKKHIAIPRYSG